MSDVTDSDLDLAGRHVAARLDRMLLRLAERNHPDGWYPTRTSRRIAKARIAQTLGGTDGCS